MEGISERYLDVVPKITCHALVTKVVISHYGNRWIVQAPQRVVVSSLLISPQNYS